MDGAQSDTVTIALAVLAFLSTLTTAVISAVVLIVSKQTQGQTVKTHDLVNSKMTDLVKSTGRAALAEGIAKGIATERADPQSPVEKTL